MESWRRPAASQCHRSKGFWGNRRCVEVASLCTAGRFARKARVFIALSLPQQASPLCVRRRFPPSFLRKQESSGLAEDCPMCRFTAVLKTGPLLSQGRRRGWSHNLLVSRRPLVRSELSAIALVAVADAHAVLKPLFMRYTGCMTRGPEHTAACATGTAG